MDFAGLDKDGLGLAVQHIALQRLDLPCDTKVGGLTIIKTDEETGERISGVQFEIRKLNGEIVGTYTTDRSGVISLPEAEKGWYQVTELKAAKGYQLDSQPYQIEVKDGERSVV